MWMVFQQCDPYMLSPIQEVEFRFLQKCDSRKDFVLQNALLSQSSEGIRSWGFFPGFQPVSFLHRWGRPTLSTTARMEAKYPARRPNCRFKCLCEKSDLTCHSAWSLCTCTASGPWSSTVVAVRSENSQDSGFHNQQTLSIPGLTVIDCSSPVWPQWLFATTGVFIWGYRSKAHTGCMYKIIES